MTKLLHTFSKINFANPYVIRVEYSVTAPDEEVERKYRASMKIAYRSICGTWGYSQLINEHIQIKNDHNHPAGPGPVHYTGMTQTQIMGSILDPDWSMAKRGYICFKDEEDALYFRLSIDTAAIRVSLWPAKALFTIHETTGS